ncbi:hypothetical protein WG922_19830 [Ramlibacter sp. AN1015]|uniref:hypothetical protein n=1 Tax=Ramlibacter sp. AN1015 TaxID=3133428 RepID=UPI0030C29D52
MSTLIAAVLAAVIIGFLSFWVQEAAAVLLLMAAGGAVLAAVLLVLSARGGPGSRSR